MKPRAHPVRGPACEQDRQRSARHSQLANKRLAGQLLASKLQALAEAQVERHKGARRQSHLQTERGNAARVFAGMDFVEAGALSRPP